MYPSHKGSSEEQATYALSLKTQKYSSEHPPALAEKVEQLKRHKSQFAVF